MPSITIPWSTYLCNFLLLTIIVTSSFAEGSQTLSERAARLLAIEMAAELATAGDEAASQRIESAYKSLLADEPNYIESRISLASWLSDSERNEEAYSILVSQIEGLRDSPYGQRLMGELALRTGRAPEAAKALAQAVKLVPDSPGDHFHLANVLFLFRNELTPEFGKTPADVIETALGHFRIAMQLAPDSLQMAQAHAEIFYSIDPPRWEEALTAWEAIRDAHPEAADFANTHIVRIALKLGRTEQAKVALQAINSPRFDEMKQRFATKIRQAESGQSQATTED